jgi:hypothetical protein
LEKLKLRHLESDHTTVVRSLAEIFQHALALNTIIATVTPRSRNLWAVLEDQIIVHNRFAHTMEVPDLNRIDISPDRTDEALSGDEETNTDIRNQLAADIANLNRKRPASSNTLTPAAKKPKVPLTKYTTHAESSDPMVMNYRTANVDADFRPVTDPRVKREIRDLQRGETIELWQYGITTHMIELNKPLSEELTLLWFRGVIFIVAVAVAAAVTITAAVTTSSICHSLRHPRQNKRS